MNRETPEIRCDIPVGNQNTESSGFEFITNMLSDVGSTKQVIDVYRDWLVRCSPLRLVSGLFEVVFSWKYINGSLLAMISLLFLALHENMLLIALLCIACGGLPYIALLSRNGILLTRERPFDDIQANLKFNHFLMRSWCDNYDRVSAISPAYIFRTLCMLIGPLSITTLWVSPIKVLIACVWAFLILRLREKLPRETSARTTETEQSGGRRSFEVYENQRWWFGSWLSGSTEIFPWSDATGCRALSKSDVALPDPEWEWEGLWCADSRGWMYSMNFHPDDASYHFSQGPLDFVRRRRWIRNCIKLTR